MRFDKTLAKRPRFFNKIEITAYILAGGQSSRIGFDKLLTQVNNNNLLEKTIKSCSLIIKTVKIVAKEKTKFAQFPNEILIDSHSADGPLAGIIAALEDCSKEFCFITAADFFDLNSHIISTIINEYANEQYLGMFINGMRQPLCGIYHKSSLHTMKKSAGESNYKMSDVLKKLNARFVKTNIAPWRNINHPIDFEAIKREYV
jgi:molybdenum cofactor guanylyltransferase